jgi:hypothetical protein
MKKPTTISPVTTGISPRMPALPKLRTSYRKNQRKSLLNGVGRAVPMNSIIFAMKADFIPYNKINDMIASSILSSAEKRKPYASNHCEYAADWVLRVEEEHAY